MCHRSWPCLRFFDLLFWRRDVEQPSTEVQLHLPMTIGKQTVMMNAMEAVWHGVQQEATDELVCMQRHPLLATAGSVILPSKGDAIAVHADEAGIGDGDAMGVATEIGQHLFGSCEWRLGIDHPADTMSRFQRSIEGSRMGQAGDIAEELKLAELEGVLQLFEKQPPEQAG